MAKQQFIETPTDLAADIIRAVAADPNTSSDCLLRDVRAILQLRDEAEAGRQAAVRAEWAELSK